MVITMGKYNEAMGDFKSSRKQKKEQVPIKKCQYHGCDHVASVIDSNGPRCNWHETGDYSADVTQAIKDNQNYIDGYNKMVYWDGEDWHKQKTWLEQNVNCPMSPGEPPSIYLIRFYNWIAEKIRTDSVEIINKRLNYSSVGADQ